MCIRTSDKMKISDKLAIRREVGGGGGAIAPPPHPTEISATESGSIRDDSYWTSRKNSLGQIDLPTIK